MLSSVGTGETQTITHASLGGGSHRTLHTVSMNTDGSGQSQGSPGADVCDGRFSSIYGHARLSTTLTCHFFPFVSQSTTSPIRKISDTCLSILVTNLRSWICCYKIHASSRSFQFRWSCTSRFSFTRSTKHIRWNGSHQS